jgi:hypothetical protein
LNVEIFADDIRVEQRHAVVGDQGRNLAERVVAHQREVRLDDRGRRALQIAGALKLLLNQTDTDLADEGRNRPAVQLHRAGPQGNP